MYRRNAGRYFSFSRGPHLERHSYHRGSRGCTQHGVLAGQKGEREGGEKLGRAWELGLSQLKPVDRLTTTKKKWWLLVMAVTIPRAVAQAAGEVENGGKQPGVVFKGVPMSHASYQLEAFDCDEPQDIITRSIPSNCNPEI